MYRRLISLMRGAILFDNFDDNSIDTAKWTATGSADIAIAEISTELRISADAIYSGSANQGDLTSVSSFNLTGKTIQVDVPSPSTNLGTGASAAGGSQFLVQDTGNANNQVYTLTDSANIFFRRSNNGTLSGTNNTTGVTSHTKWRMVHNPNDNTWLFYTWTGSAWSLRFTSAAANWNPTSCKIALIGYIYGANQTNIATRFDNLIVF